jgi:uncharacterized Fe-S cluster-containing radical SAM superfamily protein
MEKFVSKDYDEVRRKYWRFRADRWYGGIATADCVGCGLTCRFCWVKDKILYNPKESGYFYSPKQVAKKLKLIANNKGYHQVRVSGGEPTILGTHLLQLLQHLKLLQPLHFILETNGILIGHSARFARELSQFDFLHVRLSLKGCNGSEFKMLTGASAHGFSIQLEALRKLVSEKVSCHAAVMRSFSSTENVLDLKKNLANIHPKLANELEMEEVILYPEVKKKIERFKLNCNISHETNRIPDHLV